MEQTAFLLAVVVAVAVFGVIDRNRGAGAPSATGRVAAVTIALALVLGALAASASLADRSTDWWPGLIAGTAAAGLGFAATRSLLVRVRARLDARPPARCRSMPRGWRCWPPGSRSCSRRWPC